MRGQVSLGALILAGVLAGSGYGMTLTLQQQQQGQQNNSGQQQGQQGQQGQQNATHNREISSKAINKIMATSRLRSSAARSD